MALMLEAVNAAGATQRFPIQTGRNQFAAQPGMRYRIIDDSGASVGNEATVKRIGNDLVIEDLSDKRVVELDEFFARCTPEASCTLATDNLGGVTGSEITPVSQPVAALNDGSFIMVPSSAVQTTSLAEATTGVSTTAKAVGIGLGVLGLAAAGGGGGGGGGGSNVEPPPATQPVKMNALAITNDTTPVISGTGTPGSGMLLTVSGNGVTVAYNVVVGGDGNWTLDTGTATPASGSLPAGGLAQGNYSVSYRVIVNNAPVDGTFDQSIAIDTTPPAAPIISSPAGGTVVNAAAAAAGVTFSGSAETGSTVRVSWFGTQTVATDASGHWTATFKGDQVAGSGEHLDFSAVAIDPAGNTSAAAQIDMVLQTGRPLLTMPDPVAGDDVVNKTERDAGVLLHGRTSPGAEVQVVWGTTTLTTRGDASGNWSITVLTAQVPADGNTQIQMTATDSAGNTTTATHAVTVDITAPPVPTINPVATDDFVNPSERDADTGIVLSGTAEAGSTLTLTWGNTAPRTIVVGTSGTWQSVYASTDLPSEGMRIVTAIATDVAGNASTPATRNVVLDYTPPAAPASAPDMTAATDTGVSNTDNITSNTRPSFTIAPPASGDTLRLLVDGVFVPSTLSGSTVTPNAALTENAHSITYQYQDAAGNIGAASSALTIVIDTQPPATPASAPDMTAASDTGISDTDNITSNARPSFAISAPQSGDTVVLRIDGATVASTYSGGIVTPNSNIAAGTHSVTYLYQDTAGNLSSPSTALPITIVGTPTKPASAPDLTAASDTGSSNTDNITSDTTPSFSVAAPGAGLSVALLVDGAVVGSTYSGGLLTATSALSNGPHTITYRYEGAGGIIGPASDGLTITIDTAAPAAPISAPDLQAASDTGASNIDNITSIPSPSFTIVAPPAGSTMQFVVDGSPVPTTYTGGTSAQIAALADGVHSIGYRYVSEAGIPGAASSTLSVTIDTAPPPTPTSAPDMTAATDTGSSNTDNITSNPQPQFTIAAFPGDAVIGMLLVDGAYVATYSPGPNTLQPVNDIPIGTHEISYAYGDAAGNISTGGPTLPIQIVAGPTAPTTAPDLQATSDSGVSATDNITNDATPSFNIVPPGAGLTPILMSDGTVIPSTYAAGVLTSTVTLTDGTHNIAYAYQSASGDRSAASPALPVTIDTIPPSHTVTLGQIIDDSGGLPGVVIPEGGTTSDHVLAINITLNSVLAAGETVHLMRNGTEIANAISGNTWAFDDTTVTPSVIPYTYTVNVTDLAGNSTGNLFTQHITVT